jgi:peptidyl-Lys metalloendopeptidase
MAHRSGIVLLLLVIAGCAGRSSSAGPGSVTAGRLDATPLVSCQLQAPEHVGLAEPVVPVTFVLHNAGTAEVRVLARHTPLEGILGDLFDVILEGQRLAYLGPVVKRGPPEPTEYVTLAPGDHVRATVDLLDGYDLSPAGKYTVRFTSTDHYTCNELRIKRD